MRPDADNFRHSTATKTSSLPLTFLKPGLTYNATIYTDDPAVQTATHVAVAHRTVTRNDTLDLALQSPGGEAIYLTPGSK